MEKNILNILDNYRVVLENIENSKNPLIDIPVYIINLKINNYRRSYIKYITKKMEINCTLVIVEKVSQDILDNINSINIGKNLRQGVFGCYLSHLWCIKNAIENNYQYFIIFEDDILFHKNFKELFYHINYKKYDMIQLGCCDFNLKSNLDNSNINKYTKLHQYNPKKIALGAYGNIYNIHFAKMIFNDKIRNPLEFDVDFDNYYEKYNISICYPNLITSELSTTDINHNFSIFSETNNRHGEFIRSCFKEFNFKNYYFIWIIFIEYCYLNNKSKIFSKDQYESMIINFSDNYVKIKNVILDILMNNEITFNDMNHIINIINNDIYIRPVKSILGFEK